MKENPPRKKKIWLPESPETGNYHYRKFVSRRKILATPHSSEERELMYIVDWQQNDKSI